MGRDHKPGAHAQEHRILWQLQASFPGWTPAPVLSQISLQYNARIFSLRGKGWQIANRVEIRDGVKHGAFRLATPGTFRNPRPRREGFGESGAGTGAGTRARAET